MPAVRNRERVQKERRKKRIRSKLMGTPERPRISVYRSNLHIYAQLVDDFAGHTITSADSREVEGAENKTDAARKVGELLAERAGGANVEVAVFDRGGNKYHGRVAALAEGARSGGLKF